MSNMHSKLIAAALVGMLTATERPRREVLVVDDPDAPPPEPPKPREPSAERALDAVQRAAQARYDAACIVPPVLGKRQGERMARQKLDYSASDKCLARIRERLTLKGGTIR
jgi:hypothetical protein